ncbi:ESX secretion-associated protein EspG [Rhodococcus sp. BP-252]|uniref:ESX secretion-associated protein EspG n=1 Tax=unclassified Rhodococcus (in: high G+C Gram-positive bacteria) TaxID=192944 RepID=UPI001C9A8CD2|nr:MULTISPECIES: ESX secretion-associated protein EspG [unclassified Rhodococcus (in: high G+C Gram-positive bacteria)]MBY6411781.1 ESX secretion-associated protein EspG [Rhodococcus sp. BP-320]MBY6419807.1 ESX secretion-associated protein EspG [Rhodococcus sp. BP-321]MBY6424778.1 ESX secretion-associated protein EspG [Rhodococcus sp. BP-324]MBY6429749.1 ESX secretion-associated protein EspG [Rhodococcus sp. BP-323]MBY6434714.1 ESX secretion-associated protein EspG [Rhodococcus sp. BP-322]
MIDLGTRPVGHGLPFVELDDDCMDYLVERLGIAELPVVLDVFPRFDAAADRQAALVRGRAGLVEHGAVSDDHVHPDLEAWLRTLERPTWYIAARLVPRPYGTGSITRVCRAASESGSVIAVRRSGLLTIRATVADPARDVLDAVGSEPALDFVGVSAPTDTLAEALDASPTDAGATADRLASLGIDRSAAADIASALATCTAHIEITCTTTNFGTSATDPLPIAVFDTPRGRLVATTSTAADGRRWTSFAPGSDARIRSALTDMAQRAEASGVS